MHSKLSECRHSVRETSIALRNLEITPFGYNFGLKHNLERGLSVSCFESNCCGVLTSIQVPTDGIEGSLDLIMFV
jgi:hypothetical protein